MNGSRNWLYVITPEGADTPCKVGHSCWPEQRAKNLSTGSPVRLVLRHAVPIDGPKPKWGSSRPYWACDGFARQVEGWAHKRLGNRRRRSEWFHVSCEDAIAVIETAVKENRFAA